MGVGSGLGAQLGMKAESVYGTFVAVDRFLVGWMKGVPQFKPSRVQGGGMYAGEVGPRGDRYVETLRQGSGTITVEVSRNSFGIILNHLLASGAIAQQGGSAAWLQTHIAVADQLGKSLTIQAGVPQTDGTSKPYTFLGCKIQKATFTCDNSGGDGSKLTCDIDIDFRDMTEAQVLAVPSYVSGSLPFTFKELGVKLGNFGAEAGVQGVRKVTLTIDRPLKTDRFYGNNAGLKSEPITNGPVLVSGTLDTDFVDKTIFVDRYVANTATSLVLEWVGPIIASTFNNAIRFKLPTTFFTGDTPDVAGADVIDIPIPFESKLGANGMCSAEYMSTDIAI